MFGRTDKTVYLKVCCIMPGTHQAPINFSHLFSHSKLNPYLWSLEWDGAKLWQRKEKRVVLEISGYLERGQAENRVNEFFKSSFFLLPLLHLSNPLSPTSLLNRTAWAALEWVSI